MNDEQPHQELVKCVLVGDNAVGKTRLICARAMRQKVSLSQLLNTHVPTVWAIDQYRIYKEVLENSWMVLDGVNVSLRLWDTFGDHHKDRRFAYGRSDVVLMCFDIGRVSSLENCREMWYPQIKKFCPNTPILLVGCKNDVRFIFRDEQYLKYCQERSPLVRQVRESDLVMPEQGRAVAKELGVPYYETSVLTYYGVNEVFENSIRAALRTRSQQRFWMTNLKKVLTPTLQEPFCPPRPKLPSITLHESTYQEDRSKLFQHQNFTDIIFLCGSVGFSAHRFLVSAISPLLHRILASDLFQELPPTRSNSETSLLSVSLGSSPLCGDFNDDTECLIQSETSTPSRGTRHSPREQLRYQRLSNTRRASFHNSSPGGSSSIIGGVSTAAELKPGVFRAINHPAFHSLRIQQCESLDAQGKVVASVQTVLTCTKLITPQSMSQIVRYFYTGTIDPQLCNLPELKQAAEFLEIPDLFNHISNLINKRPFMNEDLIRKNLQNFRRGLEEVCFVEGLFSDILFRLEDGTCHAHKPILMARCDMMQAMFTHEDFVESSAKIVKFPGVSRFSFQELLYYLYTDQAPRVSALSCLGILELANRLCLPRLITMIEETVIGKMLLVTEQGGEVTEEALKILQPCQMHNADQLADWCLSYLAQNYNHICRKYPKILRSLHPENQAALNVSRWPPIWYLKDFDNYQRMLMERERHERPKNLKRTRNNSGCLCFSGKSSKNSSKRD